MAGLQHLEQFGLLDPTGQLPDDLRASFAVTVARWVKLMGGSALIGDDSRAGNPVGVRT